MAEDQEKQKPKATLIKKRPESAETVAEKKKVRVVVKRKPKPKVVAKKRPPVDAADDTQAAVQQPSETPSAEVARPQSPTPAERSERPQPTGEAEPKKPVRPAAEDTRPSPQESPRSTPPTAGPRVFESGRRGAPQSSQGGPRRAGGPPARDGGGMNQQRRGPRRDGDFSSGPRRDFRGGSGPRRDGGPPRGPGQGRPSGPPRPGNRPNSRPSPGGRGPAPSGGPGRGPGGPGRGPGGPGAQQQRQPGKRFYKSKKRGPYNRDDRQREKEINFNKKKQQPKANPVPKEIDIMEVVTVNELARKMNLKANELIGKLMSMGMMVTINQQIDRETAEILAGEYGAKVNVVSLYDETIIETAEDKEEDLKSRPPIVTVMGHVDHGKTKLLDAIRSTNVVAGEHGGITQHIGAYQVSLDQNSITFLDTPGHEAFTLMRARGAQITDIVILVVAANDGVMPQTREAISHAKEAKVPIIVAINKVDLPEANVDRVKQQLSELELIPEDWGGQTAMVEVSALKKEGIEDLLETVLVQAEVLELKANWDRNAEGKVVESRIDPGRGTIATVLIERGTLKVGDSFIAGIFPGRVRAMFDDRGRRVEQVTPSAPVEILGFDGVPEAGDPFQVTEDDKTARQVGAKRQELKRVEEAKNVKKVTLDNLYDSIQDGAIQELKVVIKGDVHGSVEALQSALEKLSTKEIRLVAIHASAGAINEGDIMLASASNALVVGFHVRPTPRAQQLAEREKVEIRKYSIIYDAVEDIRAAMEGMLAPELQEETIGAVEVRDIFKVPKIGIVAGSYVIEGKVRRNANVRVFRDNVQIHEGTISSLKRFKDDAREVDAGYECGIGISNLQDVQVGDTLEIYVVKEVAKKLGSE